VALVLCGLFTCKLAYSRSLKVNQNSIFANFLAFSLTYLRFLEKKFGSKVHLKCHFLPYIAPSLFAVSGPPVVHLKYFYPDCHDQQETQRLQIQRDKGSWQDIEKSIWNTNEDEGWISGHLQGQGYSFAPGVN